MLRRHKATGADCTISVMEVPWEEASRFGIMAVDGDDNITEFAEKPKEPKSNLASMGIYIFTWKKLRQYLIDDETDPRSDNDFGKTSSPLCCETARGCPPTASRATGRTWARWTPCGTPTWICSPPAPG